MKRVLCLALALLMVFCITACGGSSDKKAKVDTKAAQEIKDEFSGKFRAGYGKVNITPSYPVPLQGFGNVDERLSQGCLDYLYAICIAVSDENDNSVLLFNLDLCGLNETYGMNYRNAISKITGVPVKNIIMNCTHTHSAPAINSGKAGLIAQYRIDLNNWLQKAAVEAMNDRAPASLLTGSTEATGLSFIRHYYDVNGLCFGDNHNSISHADAARHTTEIDPTMHLLKFDRSATKDKKDIFYINWRSHPHRTGAINCYDISSDIIGAMRIDLEEKTGGLSAYYQGAAGNINPTTKLASETIPADYIEHGKKLSEFAQTILKNLTEVKSGEIEIKEQTFTGDVNHDFDNMTAFAREVAQVFKDTNDPHAAQRLAMTKGLYSTYHCNAIISRASKPLTAQFNITSLTIGDSLGFVYAPYEMFDTNSVYIEDNSPFKYTFVQGYSNGSQGYIPSQTGYDYGCYEGDTSTFRPGTGEKVADTFLKTLKELKSDK